MKTTAKDSLLEVAGTLLQVLEDVVYVRKEVKELKVMVCVLIIVVIVKLIF